MEECGMSIIKFLLFFFNFVFAILGILIIVASSLDISYVREYSNNGEVTGLETSIILIVVGILIVFIAGLGCYGAIKESPRILYLFAGLLALVIIVELSVGIAAAALRPQMESAVKKHLRDTFIKNKGNSGYRVFWDRLQVNLHCCGVIGPDDYADPVNKVPVPPASCCPTDYMRDQTEQNRRNQCVAQQMYYKIGCEDKIMMTVHGAGIGVIVTGIVFCFIEVIGIILALWLAQAIKRDKKEEEPAEAE